MNKRDAWKNNWLGKSLSGSDIYEVEDWNKRNKTCYLVENAFGYDFIYRTSSIERPFSVGEQWYQPRYYETFLEAVERCEYELRINSGSGVIASKANNVMKALIEEKQNEEVHRYFREVAQRRYV